MIFRFISRFFKTFVVIFLVVATAYLSACIYVNFIQREPGEYRLPSINKAQYEIIIKNTNRVLYTSDYETDGSKIIVKGYWELKDNDFKYRDNQIILDENTFGTILIKRR